MKIFVVISTKMSFPIVQSYTAVDLMALV